MQNLTKTEVARLTIASSLFAVLLACVLLTGCATSRQDALLERIAVALERQAQAPSVVVPSPALVQPHYIDPQPYCWPITTSQWWIVTNSVMLLNGVTK